MRKRVNFFSPLVVIFILTSFRLDLTTELTVPKSLIVNKPTQVLFPKNKALINGLIVTPPFLGNCYIGFKEALAFKESQGNYFITNTLGYLGKYQFGVGTLQLMGIYDTVNFLNDPVLQEKVFYTNVSRNKWILRKDVKRFIGKRINGIVITESGILASAHLAGAGNVKKFLRSYGKNDVSDDYGTKLSCYMEKFSGYDVSTISPKPNPRI